jgi:prepilin-type N-terminal cleavage/methylation domain-containing protein
MTRVVRSEAGMTLVELLMAVAIIGIAVVSIVGAMGTSIIGTDRHRKQAQAHTVLLSAVDSVKSQTYVPCATAGSYTPATGVTLPAGWTASYVTVQSVTYWNGLTFGPSACSPDPKLQLVKVQVATPDGRATESVSVVKRNPS